MEAEKLDGYGKSKLMAEKAAWDYVKELPGNLVTL
jgi:nucleoside-diphosphate-sugar epimerase